MEAPPAGAARLVLGTSRLTDPEAARMVYDEFFASGGRWFDTARVYRSGASEQAFGVWLAYNGVREQVRIIGKGGHPDVETWRSRVTEGEVLADARESLAALGIDRFDHYFLHRDEEDLPSDDLIGSLRAVQGHGLTAGIGVSNWRPGRYAEALTAEGDLSLSNYFGLAVPGGPPALPGLVSSFDAGTHRALASRSNPLFAWSALSAGYFEVLEPSAGLYSTHPASILRKQVVRSLGARAGVPAESIVVRWLATAAEHLRPVISTTRPGRIGSLMADADDRALDPLVEELLAACAVSSTEPSRRLLLPSVAPAW